jgi:hypothetical protein
MSGLKGSEMDVADWQSQEIGSSSQSSCTDDMVPLFREARQGNVNQLARAIENEIIPRLLDARRKASIAQSQRES